MSNRIMLTIVGTDFTRARLRTISKNSTAATFKKGRSFSRQLTARINGKVLTVATPNANERGPKCALERGDDESPSCKESITRIGRLSLQDPSTSMDETSQASARMNEEMPT
jgi:hypothetical protein